MANLTVVKGTDKTFSITLTNRGTGAAIDITGDTIFFTVKENPTDSDDDALIKVDVTTHTDPTNGQTAIELDHDDTNIIAGSYYYDIKRVTEAGQRKVYALGKFIVTQNITVRSS